MGGRYLEKLRLKIYFVIVGMIVTNFTNILYFWMISGMYDGLNIMVQDLQIEISGKSTDQAIKKKIKEIVDAFVDVRSLMDFLQDTFEIYYLVEIETLIFQATLSLFAAVTVILF